MNEEINHNEGKASGVMIKAFSGLCIIGSLATCAAQLMWSSIEVETELSVQVWIENRSNPFRKAKNTRTFTGIVAKRAKTADSGNLDTRTHKGQIGPNPQPPQSHKKEGAYIGSLIGAPYPIPAKACKQTAATKTEDQDMGSSGYAGDTPQQAGAQGGSQDNSGPPIPTKASKQTAATRTEDQDMGISGHTRDIPQLAVGQGGSQHNSRPPSPTTQHVDDEDEEMGANTEAPSTPGVAQRTIEHISDDEDPTAVNKPGNEDEAMGQTPLLGGHLKPPTAAGGRLPIGAHTTPGNNACHLAAAMRILSHSNWTPALKYGQKAHQVLRHVAKGGLQTDKCAESAIHESFAAFYPGAPYEQHDAMDTLMKVVEGLPISARTAIENHVYWNSLA